MGYNTLVGDMDRPSPEASNSDFCSPALFTKSHPYWILDEATVIWTCPWKSK